MDDIIGIYKIENIINHKVYIGQSCHINRRFTEHKHTLKTNTCYNHHLQSAWNKYGENAFVFSIIEECKIEELNDREMYWIKSLDSFKNGYNLNEGGGGVRGYKMSVESVNKIKMALVGKPKSQEAIDNSREGLKTYYKTHVNPRSIRIVCLNTNEIFNNASEGKRKYVGLSTAHIRSCCNGRLRSHGEINGEKLVWKNYEDYILMSQLDITQYIKRANSDRYGSNNPNSKQVVCLNTGEIFETIQKAANKYGATINRITKCCLGKNYSSGKIDDEKLVWAYYNDYIHMSSTEITNKIIFAQDIKSGKNNPKARKILCVTTGEIFDTIKDASLKYGANRTTITRCCKNQAKTSGGMEWQYYTA